MAQKTALGKGLASLLPGSAPNPSANSTPMNKASGEQSDTSSKPSSKTDAPTAAPSSQLPAGATAAGTPVPAMPLTPSAPEMASKDRHMGISMANLDDIHANQRQPRRDFDDLSLQELAASIKTSGIIQPLVVRKNEKGILELIAGERRLKAARLAGLKQVPIVIRRATTDRESLELALIENIQRQNLNCVDEALAYFQLIQDFSLTQEEVADRVGKDRATVANYLRLLRLPPSIIEDLKKQILSFGHSKALLGLDDADQRVRARNQIIEKRLSVRETEALIESMKNANTKPQEHSFASSGLSPIAARLSTLAQELTRYWSSRVEVKGNERRGKIVIHYANRQELERILEGMRSK